MKRALAAITALAFALAPAAPSISQPAPAPSARLLVMGSSTTACTGPSSTAACYVNLIAAARPGMAMTVLARAGTYVAYGPPATNWTQTVIPGGHAVVVIQLGINDWYVPVQPAEYRAQLDELLGRVKAANPGAKLIWLGAWMPTYAPSVPDPRPKMWQDHGEATAAAMRAAGGVFLDLHPDGTRRGAAPYQANETGWHYNDLGHRKLADAVLAVLP